MRRRFWVSITLGLAALVLLPVSGATAPLSQKISGTRSEIAQKRSQEGVLTSTIESYTTRIESLQGQISGLRGRQARIQARLTAKQAELAEIGRKLRETRLRLKKLRADLGVAEEALARRLVEIYKADEPDALTVVLEADGFADLLERTEFLDRVSEQDQRIVSRVRDLKAGVTQKVKDLGVLQERARAAAAEIRARRNELVAARTKLERSQADLVSARGQRQGALARIRSSRARLEGTLEKFEAEQARVRRALAAGVRGTGGGPKLPAGPIKRGSGNLIFPVSGPIVSPFGMRWGRLHAGIDIAVPSGTPIRAADSGRVTVRGVVGGYGNYTCVQHGGSLSTCYAHQSRFGTSQGATVRQGQVIGYVGCTGHCFGDHLHFETRVNGSPVDPMRYL